MVKKGFVFSIAVLMSSLCHGDTSIVYFGSWHQPDKIELTLVLDPKISKLVKAPVVDGPPCSGSHVCSIDIFRNVGDLSPTLTQNEKDQVLRWAEKFSIDLEVIPVRLFQFSQNDGKLSTQISKLRAIIGENQIEAVP